MTDFKKLLAERGHIAALLDVRRRAEIVEADISDLVEALVAHDSKTDFVAASLFVLTEGRNSTRRALDWLRLGMTLCAALAKSVGEDEDA